MLANLGGQALAVVLKDKTPATQQAIGEAYGVGVNVGVMLPYSRSHESEADHIGLVLMAKAGYDPAKAVDFWKRMEEATGAGASGLAAYMSTHPANVKRVQQIQEWLPEVKAQYYKP
jgi:predicted Zn-dependent protease